MTSQIFKVRVLLIAVLLLAFCHVQAQEAYQSFLENAAKLKRWEAMCPDSVQPKYQLALASLNYAVTNPHDSHVEQILADVAGIIGKMKQMKGVDYSDIYTLTGFLYIVRIVQNPARNGQRYYLDVMENLEKALKLNPKNEVAKQLQQKFYEGMRQATGAK